MGRCAKLCRPVGPRSRGQTEDRQDIENIAAKNGADSNVAAFSQGRNHGGHEFGNRGAERDQSETNHALGYPGRLGDFDSACNQHFRAAKQAKKAASQCHNHQPWLRRQILILRGLVPI